MADSLITVRLGANLQVNRQVIPEASGTTLIIDTENVAPLASKVVAAGERITVDFVEVTAATVRIVALWVGVDVGAA